MDSPGEGLQSLVKIVSQALQTKSQGPLPTNRDHDLGPEEPLLQEKGLRVCQKRNNGDPAGLQHQPVLADKF